MGGRGSSAAGSQGIGAPATPQARTQQLMAQVAADPTSLASMSDADTQAVVQAIARLPIATDGTQEDTFVQRFLNHVGFTAGKPRVLDEASFNAAATKSGARVLYHADNSVPGRTSTLMAQQLLTGPAMYVSGGIYGDGTYWATRASDSAGYALTAGTQVKGFISKARGRVAKGTAADNAVTDFHKQHPNTWAWLQQNAKTKRGYSPSDSILTLAFVAAGYNAYDAGSYKVTFDRSALTICGKTRKVRRGMRNW